MSATADQQPAWRHETAGERRWWTAAVMVAVGVIHVFLPEQLAALRSPEITGVIIIVLAIVLFLSHPGRIRDRTPMLRVLSLSLLLVLIVVNLVSLVLLVHAIVAGDPITPGNLLLGGAIVWLTNVVAFAFLFWEYDRGGPAARAHAEKETPDLQFPQMTDDKLAATFSPEFVDYLYVAFTNALAFSPTDTMPLSRWSKGLFALESLVSFGTIALVAARAVNILPS